MSLYKLMAYKDEYEVARLHTSSDFLARLQEHFEGDFTVSYYLAPPLLARRDAQGRPVKQRWAPGCRRPSRLPGVAVPAREQFSIRSAGLGSGGRNVRQSTNSRPWLKTC